MLIVEREPKSIISEAYKIIRTNIDYSSYDSNLQVIVITSTKMSEGKSTVASNMAMAMSLNNKKVILIDCDLRRPTTHKKLMLSNTSGLSEVILGIKKLDSSIQNYKKNFDVLTSGKIPPNPSEMLNSENMDRLLKFLKNQYDYIILDTPPVLAVTDSKILATRADGVIFVVMAGHAKKDEIVRAKSQLKNPKINIIGTVLNGVKENSRENYYYYYGETEEKKSFFKRKKNKH